MKLHCRYIERYAVFFDEMYIIELYEGNSYEEALRYAMDARKANPSLNIRFFDSHINKEIEF